MKEFLQVNFYDIFKQSIKGKFEVIIEETLIHSLTLTGKKNSGSTQKEYIDLEIPGFRTFRLKVIDLNSHFWDFEGYFIINHPPSGNPELEYKKLDLPQFVNMHGSSRGSGDYTHIVDVFLSEYRDVTPETVLGEDEKPLIDRPIRNTKIDDDKDAVYVDIPSHPVINDQPVETDGKVIAVGWDRLNTSHRPKTFGKGTPGGGTYIAERRGNIHPKIIMIWIPPNCSVCDPNNRLDYNLYLHPHILEEEAKDYGSYPFGHGSSGVQGYIDIGYRHLFSEHRVAYQQLYTGKKVIIIMPIGRFYLQQGDLLNQSAAYRLINEINFFIQRVKGCNYITWATRNIGRIALSGWSAGGGFAIRLLSTQGNNPAQAQKFYREMLREVYIFDYNDTTNATWQQIEAWFRQGDDRRWRIYTMSMEFEKYKYNLGQAPKTIHFPMTNAIEVHNNPTRSMIILPSGFFQPPDPKGVPVGWPHGWFIKYFMTHAIAQSGFT